MSTLLIDIVCTVTGSRQNISFWNELKLTWECHWAISIMDIYSFQYGGNHNCDTAHILQVVVWYHEQGPERREPIS